MSVSTAPLTACSRTFAAAPRQAGEARSFLAGVLDGHPAADDALLCLSELVTNAIVHSRSREPGGCFTVYAVRDSERLRVEVRDQGAPWAARPPAGSGAQNGRGLLIVSQLASRWGRPGDENTGWTLWFEIGSPAGCARENPAAPRRAAAGSRPESRYLTLIDGQRLRELRRERGLSQADVAGAAGISLTTIVRLARSPCRTRTLARLATALSQDPADMTAGGTTASHPARTPQNAPDAHLLNTAARRPLPAPWG